MREHEFVTVLDRRWCLGCGLFQSRKVENASWVPAHRGSCDWCTPYAVGKGKQSQLDLFEAAAREKP